MAGWHEFWTIESGWKGSGHFQAGIVETYHVTLHLGSSTCARSAESSREGGTLGGGRIQSGRSLSRKTIHQAWYWAIMWTNSWAVVSAAGRLLANTMPYIWTVKILIYKRGLCFLSYLTLIIILPDRSHLCYTHEVPKRGEVTHITFPMWLPSPGVLWWSPARNPLSPKENTAAFVIKNHRQMGLYLSKANYKETVGPRFLWYDYKMPQHPNEEMDKKHVRLPLLHLLGLLGLCSQTASGSRGEHWGERSLGLNQETYTCCHDNLPIWIFKS